MIAPYVYQARLIQKFGEGWHKEKEWQISDNSNYANYAKWPKCGMGGSGGIK